VAGASHVEIVAALARVRRRINHALVHLNRPRSDYVQARRELSEVLDAVHELRAIHADLLTLAAAQAAERRPPD
jgi:hypothetical protein